MPNLTDTQMQSIASRVNDLVGELKSAGIVAEQSRFNHLFGRNTAKLIKIDFTTRTETLVEVFEITTNTIVEFQNLQGQSVSDLVSQIQHIIDKHDPAAIYFKANGLGEAIMDKINVSGCITVPVRHLLFPTYKSAAGGGDE